jgi:hypothetical protein
VSRNLGAIRHKGEWNTFRGILGSYQPAYLAQRVLIHKEALALSAIVLVVSLGSHMILHSLLCVEFFGARIARHGREPMILRIHVLVGGVLSTEGTSTHLALKGRRPVVYSVHMLPA